MFLKVIGYESRRKRPKAGNSINLEHSMKRGNTEKLTEGIHIVYLNETKCRFSNFSMNGSYFKHKME